LRRALSQLDIHNTMKSAASLRTRLTVLLAIVAIGLVTMTSDICFCENGVVDFSGPSSFLADECEDRCPDESSRAKCCIEKKAHHHPTLVPRWAHGSLFIDIAVVPFEPGSVPSASSNCRFSASPSTHLNPRPFLII